MDGHSRDAHDVKIAEGVPVNFFDVLVEQIHVVVSTEARDGRERTRYHRASLVTWVEGKGEVETPIRWLESRVDQADR